MSQLDLKTIWRLFDAINPLHHWSTNQTSLIAINRKNQINHLERRRKAQELKPKNAIQTGPQQPYASVENLWKIIKTLGSQPSSAHAGLVINASRSSWMHPKTMDGLAEKTKNFYLVILIVSFQRVVQVWLPPNISSYPS